MSSHWRTLVIGALIALMPFSGMRVICLSAPAESTSSAPVDPQTECERLCPLHQPSQEDGSDCALSAEGLSIVASSGIAVVQVQVPPQVPDVAPVVYIETPRFLPEPELPHFSPPPKPQAI